MTQASNEAPTDATSYTYLRTLPSIRARTSLLLSHPEHLKNFTLDLGALPKVVDLVVELIKRDYLTPGDIPMHSRWRHFEAVAPGSSSDGKRVERLIAEWKAAGVDEKEVVRRVLDLFVVSVLVDAGAGDKWKYTPKGESAVYGRSEGLALASFDWFVDGGLSSSDNPHQVDAGKLESLTEDDVRKAFQVSSTNPLVGVEGRTSLLRRLGTVLRTNAKHFSTHDPSIPPTQNRPGNLLDYLLANSPHPTTKPPTTTLPISLLWEVVLEGLAPIWPPTRTTLNNAPLGDVWPSQSLLSISQQNPSTSSTLSPSAAHLIPFHKLSQWLTYSLLEPLSLLDIAFTGTEHMTGLAEYRNGGVFVDSGVIALTEEARRRGLESKGVAGVPRFEVFDDVVVEWRALTVGLLDRVAGGVRERLGVGEGELPLVKVLEAGTWKAGREVAAKLRPETKGPPIEIVSDGTVF
ncbi:hypothetical protein HDV00_003344 [Rhizophlyctis rosea]|nr:hypothetical protein HDV00_003344 [Rhizophlyctis rosea]